MYIYTSVLYMYKYTFSINVACGILWKKKDLLFELLFHGAV